MPSRRVLTMVKRPRLKLRTRQPRKRLLNFMAETSPPCRVAGSRGLGPMQNQWIWLHALFLATALSMVSLRVLALLH